jgi:hypothetical protein
VLNDDEIGLRIYAPSTAGSPKATFYSASTFSARSATAAAVPTDSVSSWTGSSIGTKQVLSLSCTPTIAGPVIAELIYCPGQASDKVIYADAVAGLS